VNEELEYITDIQERHGNLLLNLANSYFELLGEVGGLKRTILTQGRLINSCMERIMQLEGRAVLANFNQRIDVLENRMHALSQVTGSWEGRIEQLEDNTAKYYSINDKELSKMLEQTVRRVDELESWLYTHDYTYFQQVEEDNQSGNSSFEEHEINHPYDGEEWEMEHA
jgi:hypothetical protein